MTVCNQSPGASNSGIAAIVQAIRYKFSWGSFGRWCKPSRWRTDVLWCKRKQLPDTLWKPESLPAMISSVLTGSSWHWDGSNWFQRQHKYNVPAWLTIFKVLTVDPDAEAAFSVREKLNGSFIRLKTLPNPVLHLAALCIQTIQSYLTAIALVQAAVIGC